MPTYNIRKLTLINVFNNNHKVRIRKKKKSYNDTGNNEKCQLSTLKGEKRILSYNSMKYFVTALRAYTSLQINCI